MLTEYSRKTRLGMIAWRFWAGLSAKQITYLSVA